jgi:two-component system, OmpR family, response regulator VicR
MKKVLKTGQIARYCSVNFQTVLSWIQKGELKAYQLPGRGDNRVEVEDFLDFLKVHDFPVPDEFQEKSKRVLIVEDIPTIAALIEKVVQGAGYKTEIASEGLKAGALLTTFKPSIMTLDLNLPGLSGLEVLNFCKGLKGLSELKILVVSGQPTQELARALLKGADDYLRKPFDNQKLLEKVNKLYGE